MKKYFLGILLICIAFGYSKSSPLSERIYVQTDKHLYLAGEPVLMKLVTTDTDLIPLVFSKIAYVELVNNAVAQIQIKVELINGTGAGIMLLPADLPTGYYRLIAYTQYMRNESADVFFEKNIAVLNTFQSGYQPEEAETIETDYPPIISAEDRGGGVSLQPNKTVYTARERGELALSGLPENIHTLSVSIAGKDFIPAAESDISLLLKNRTKKTAEFTGSFLPEYEGHIITGKIVDNQTGEEVTDNNSIVSALSFTGDGIRIFAGQKTETGNIRFFTSGISGLNEIATVAYFADEKYRVDIQSPFVTRYVPKQMTSLSIDSSYYSRLLARSVALQVFRYFSEDRPENQNISDFNFKLKPTFSYPLDEYTRFTTMREVFIEFIVGARFSRNAGKQEISILTTRGGFYEHGNMPLVLLDGVPVSDHDAIYNYDPLSVEQINIYYGPHIMGGYQFDGIVELITYRRLHTDLSLNRSTQILTYEGPQLPYRLDTPNYSEEKNRDSRMPDTRHTLLWNPDIRTNGKTSISLSFDTSDLTGEFQATVEGITKDGEVIFATVFFRVD